MITHRQGRLGRRGKWFALVPVLALVIAACGSSDDSADDTTAPDDTTEQAAPEDTTAEDTGSDDTVAASDDTVAETEDTVAETEGGSGGELIIATPTQPNALDFVNSAERNAANIAAQIFDTLIYINDDLEFEPALAESWEVSEDGKTYTFKLREGVTFHNGEPFNADSVVFTWEAGSNPENQYATYYERAESVTAIDEYTVEVTTTDVDALFLGLMAAAWTPFPPAYYEEVGLTGFSQAPVGTGPFMLTEWEQGDRIVLDKFPDYWREGYPKLDRITFRPITESSTRAAAIQTGEVDIVNRLSPDEAASLEGVDGVNLVEYPNNRVYYIAFNNMTSGVGEPTEDPLVRQAFNYAVDTEGIISALFAGKGQRSTGLVTSGDLGYLTSLSPYEYDVDKAKELMAEAGFGDGFSMDMACPSGAYTNFEEVCQAVAAQLGEIGVTVNLDIQESGAYWDLEAAKQLPPLFGDSWSSTGIDSYQRLFGALGGEEASFSAWSDPKIDDLLAQILVTVDNDARAALYEELQQYMFDEPPFIYLYEPISFEAISDRVVNYKPRVAEEFYLWDLEAAS